jgi:hypothetical protein
MPPKGARSPAMRSPHGFFYEAQFFIGFCRASASLAMGR